MRSPSQYAERYVRLGMAVLPLHWPVPHEGCLACSCGRVDCASPAKHPFAKLVANGLRDASRDSVVTNRWFQNSELNIGIATGAVSGIIALDIDPRHRGDETLIVLERQHGPLPKTWQFLTGGGGEHILFRHPGGRVPNSAGKIGGGIDVRGDGGYIVAPPSRHISGRPYAISVDHHPDEVSLADLPAWLNERLRSRSERKPSARPAGEWRGVAGRTATEANATGPLPASPDTCSATASIPG
jgi:Bifunctional DNA primase/polymerase, N-terminal